MIGKAYKYTMLIASLPRHPHSLFAAKQPPISRIQLDRRLSLMGKEDAANLSRVEDILFWSRLSAATDAQVVANYHQAMKVIDNAFVKRLILKRLEIRSLVAALRKRNKGQPAPQKHTAWGIGRWLPFIRNNWRQSDFAIAHLVPWLPEANNLLTAEKPLELERLLLNVTWNNYAAEAEKHHFDFEAVVIYVLRWDIINRWTHYNDKKALIRFDELVDEGLKDL